MEWMGSSVLYLFKQLMISILGGSRMRKKKLLSDLCVTGVNAKVEFNVFNSYIINYVYKCDKYEFKHTKVRTCDSVIFSFHEQNFFAVC